MFDARLRPLIDPPLDRLGRALARRKVSANQLTLAGAVLGLAGAGAIAAGDFMIAIACIALSRLFDGLDGAVARVVGPTDLGGYFDILADFLFYVSVPMGFALYDPGNTLAAAVLLASFTLTGIGFLAYAAIAAKRGLESSAHGKKSFFYSTGLAEGTETIVTFVAMCVLPGYFVPIALAYAGLCVVTVIQRSLLACRRFADGK